MRIVLALLMVLGSSAAFAKTEIVRTSAYIYYRTPLNEMLPSERRVVIKRSIEIVSTAMADGLEQTGLLKPSTAERLRALEIANMKADEVIDAALDYANATEYMGVGFANLVPSAVLVHFGGKLALNFGLGGGGSVGVGLVIMPVRIDRVDILTREVVSSYKLDYSFIGFGSANVGKGIGGGGALRSGIGLIWGPLESAADFKGVAIGASGDATAGPAGLNLKLAVLKQWGNGMFLNKRVNPFVMVSWQGGLAAEADIHGNITPVISLTGPLKSLLDNVLSSQLGDEPQITDLRFKKAANKR